MSELVSGLDLDKNQILNAQHPCVSSLQGKQTRKSFPKGQARRATSRLELVHMDLCGPMREPNWDGARYAYFLTDDFARKTFVYFMENKDMGSTFAKFMEFKALVENQ